MIKKHKNKFIAAAIILIILAGAWVMGGVPEINVPDIPPTPALAAEVIAPSDEIIVTTAQVADVEEEEVGEESEDQVDEGTELEESYDESYDLDDYPAEEEYEPQAYEIDITEELSDAPDEIYYYEIDDYEEIPEPELPATSNPDYVPTLQDESRFMATPEGVVVPTLQGDVQIFGTDHANVRVPVEPENMVVTDEYFYVTLTVRVDSILYNMHLLHRDKHELVPSSGVIFPATLVRVYDGESVHNVLQREMRRHRIHMSSRWTPMFNSAYVEAINNLYEFDVGPLSGWMYRVNGWFPNFGASRYLLSAGDVVEWLYTVDLGRDLGVHWLHEDLFANE